MPKYKLKTAQTQYMYSKKNDEKKLRTIKQTSKTSKWMANGIKHKWENDKKDFFPLSPLEDPYFCISAMQRLKYISIFIMLLLLVTNNC